MDSQPKDSQPMDGQRSTALEIGHLHLRLPGLSAESGRRVAALAMERLAETLTSATLPTSETHLQLPRLQLRLKASAGAGPEALAESIARGVIGALADQS